MGSNFGKNLIEKKHHVVGYSINQDETRNFVLSSQREINCAPNHEYTIENLVTNVGTDGIYLMMVTAGSAVDSVLDELTPHISTGAITVDFGNTYHKETSRRQKQLIEKGITHFGIGISGGSDGARHGPAMMVGGPLSKYLRIEEILTSVAAKFDGKPCITYCGQGGEGNFVKTVHNGIEYADLGLIGEAYLVLKNGLGLEPFVIGNIFSEWNIHLKSYLLDLASEALVNYDGEIPLINTIKDVVAMKGTGVYCAHDALDTNILIPSIIDSVESRILSTSTLRNLSEPLRLEKMYGVTPQIVHDAYVVARNGVFNQGFDMLQSYRGEDNSTLPLSEIALGWSGGCIIRSAVLNDIAHGIESYDSVLQIPPIKCDNEFCGNALNTLVSNTVKARIPTPVFSATQNYLDGLSYGINPGYSLQAEVRNLFGNHGRELR